MKWVTTNIRFPEDMYMDLKMEAAKSKKSLAALVREKISKKKKPKKADVKKLLRELEKVAEINAKQNPGISFSEKLIEMRYEQ